MTTPENLTAIAYALDGAGAPPELAHKLAAIADRHRVPTIALLSWIAKGTAATTTRAGWLACAKRFPEEHRETHQPVPNL